MFRAGKASEMTTRNNALTKAIDEEAITETIDKAIGKIQAQLETNQLKPSVTDLVRLIQLRNELAGERPMDITARWID